MDAIACRWWRSPERTTLECRNTLQAISKRLIYEHSLADVATALPVRWLLSQKFDSIDKIADIHMPLLVVHGLDDRYVPPRFSQQLFEAAQQPKHLLLVPGASHNNSMNLAGRSYGQALENLMRTKMPAQVVTHSIGRDNAS